MHPLEHHCFLQSQDYRRRGDIRTAKLLEFIAGTIAYYDVPDGGPTGAEPEYILQLNAELMKRMDRHNLREDLLAFIRRKRRTTSDQIRTYYIALEISEPDEPHPPVDFKPLRRALATLVRHGLVRRYGHGAYAAVPAHERIGPHPG